MPLSSRTQWAVLPVALALLMLLSSTGTAQMPPAEDPDEAEDKQALPGFEPYNPQEALKRRLELTALSREFQKLLNDHPEVREKLSDGFARAQLKMEKCALLYGRYMPSTVRDAAFKKELAEARGIIAALSAGKKPDTPRTGLIELAYLSDIDRSAQPYYLYIPETTELERPVPLLLFLHGYIGDLDKVNWFDQTVSDSVKRLAEKSGGILLAPFARSNTDFLGIGERDVLHTIELVKRDYRIDADRVYLGGASMGGSGVWAIGAHYPHLFAALIPASGRTDYNLWHDIERGVLTPFKQFIVDRDYAVTMKPNFRNLPVFAFHGEDDWLVKPDQSRKMVQVLRERGFEALYHQFPRGDHWSCFDAFDNAGLVAWLRTKRRPARPRHVSYRTYHPRFNRAYWVTIDDFAEFGKPAEVDVHVLGPTVIRVDAKNVARLTFHDPTGKLFRGDTVKVILPDGRLVEATSRTKGGATFTLSAVPAAGLRKRGELCGPIWEAYQHPFLLVFGSTGEAEAQVRTRNRAQRSTLEWFEFAAGIPRVKKDADVTAQDIQRFNLILFGTPKTNLLINRIARHLPVKIDEGKFTIGAKTYAGKDLGLAMIYPNPLNPERTVVIYSGVHWGRGLPKNHKLDFLPDYIVFDDTIAPVSGTNNFRVAGFFDINWKLDEKLSWEGPEKAPPAPVFEVPEGWDEPPWDDIEPDEPEEP